MAKADPFDSALDLLRRLPPRDTAKNLETITKLNPSLTEELLSSVDVPLSTKQCPATKRDFLLCDYNRDGDSYRSPWSNDFVPPLSDGVKPSDRVRQLEVRMNEAMDVYRELYYEGGASSAYLWDLDDTSDGFAGCVLFKKSVSGEANEAAWDSIHVFEVTPRASGRAAAYRLTSTVMLYLGAGGRASDLGEMDLSGNMTRQAEQDMAVEGEHGHVANLGRCVEEMELKMRNLLQEVYFGKCRDVVGDLRSISSLSETNRDRATQQEMISSMKR